MNTLDGQLDELGTLVDGLLGDRIAVFDQKDGRVRADAVFDRLVLQVEYRSRAALLELLFDQAVVEFSRILSGAEAESNRIQILFRLGTVVAMQPRACALGVRAANQVLVASHHRWDIRVSAAQFLVDVDAVGNDINFWRSLPASGGENAWKFVPTVALALLKQWPDDSFRFLVESAVSAGGEAAQEILSFVRFFGRRIGDRISQGVYREVERSRYAMMSPQLRDAFELIGRGAGWNPGVGLTIAALPVVAPGDTIDLSIPVDRLNSSAASRNTRHAMLSMVSSLARVNDSATGYPRPFSDSIERSGAFRWFNRLGEAGVFGEGATEADVRMGQLDFVRETVRQDIDDSPPSSTACSEGVLLEKLRHFGKFDDAARDAAKALKACGFTDRPFVFLSSEYHQDRLLMSLAVEALRRHGLLGASLMLRRWDATSFRIGSNIDGHVMMRAHVTSKPTRFGIYRFNGMNAFVRVDKIRELHRDEPTEASQAILEIVDSFAPSMISRETGAEVERRCLQIGVKARAQLALRLGRFGSKGSVFEEIRPALSRIAEAPQRRERVSESDDESFVGFIRGDVGVYCGGAINALLVRTWWQAAEPLNFLKLLGHDEISGGLISGRRQDGGSRAHIENYLDFGGFEASRRASAAQRHLTTLFRDLGRCLSKWAKAVRGQSRLNGLSESCYAARQLLAPNRDFNFGRYAFVTSIKDPATLVHEIDTFVEAGAAPQ
ncbi:MAG: hypothetical protein IT355_17650 [Gemmatimonadaceae bacterium]|nr:hypothetical protein [Gemmatimonadaceae bacterium]